MSNERKKLSTDDFGREIAIFDVKGPQASFGRRIAPAIHSSNLQRRPAKWLRPFAIIEKHQPPRPPESRKDRHARLPILRRGRRFGMGSPLQLVGPPDASRRSAAREAPGASGLACSLYSRRCCRPLSRAPRHPDRHNVNIFSRLALLVALLGPASPKRLTQPLTPSTALGLLPGVRNLRWRR